MAFQAQHFDPLTFAQANPFLTGYNAGQQLINQGLLNQKQQLANQIQQVAAQYAQPNAQQELLKAQLNNQILQPQAQYAPQMTVAELALKRAMPNYYNALAGQAGANSSLLAAHANLLNQETPYMVQKAQADVYSDPLFAKANQAAMLQQQAQNNPQLSSILGQLNQPYSGQSFSQGAKIPYATGMAPQITNIPGAGQGSPMQNYLLYNNPLGPLYQQQIAAYGKGLEAQQTNQAKDWSTTLNDAQQQANVASQMTSFLKQFDENYPKTDESGVIAGRLPPVSTPAQAADNASNNLVAMITKQLNPKQLTNQELRFANTLKPSRQMTPENAKMSSDFWKAKSEQINENQSFLTAAKNQGVDPYTANNLWQNYINQRPAYDFSTNTPNSSYRGTWGDFLTPQAVSAAQSGRQYVPVPQFNNEKEAKNWFKSLNPSDKAALLRQQGG